MRATEPFSIMICILFAWFMPMLTHVDARGRRYDVCGGIAATDEYGQITSPNYPHNHGANLRCEITIPVPPGEKLSLSFDTIRLRACSTRRYNYVLFYAFRGPSRPIILCGGHYDNRHLGIFSFQRDVYVQFVSTFRGENQEGFSLHYNRDTLNDTDKDTVAVKETEEVLEFCKQRNNVNKSGFIVSPNYPRHYGSDMNCYMSIDVPAQSNVLFTFKKFGLSRYVAENNTVEGMAINTSISPGYFYQYQGERSGVSLKLPFVTAGQVGLSFWSAYVWPSFGIMIHYQIEDIKSGSLYDICSSNNVSASFGHITAETFPIHAQQGNDCEIRIDVPFHYMVTLTFNDFSIATDDSSKLLLELIVLGKHSMDLRYTGNDTERVPFDLSFRNTVILRLKANNSALQVGFSVHYQIKPVSADIPPASRDISFEPNARDICGNSTNDWGTSGYIKSPNYPNDYGKNLACSKTIPVPWGKKIIFLAKDFRLHNCKSGSSDLVEMVSRGYHSVVGRLSGDLTDVIPFKGEFKSGHLTFKFTSDAKYSDKGFLFLYKIVRDFNPDMNVFWELLP